VAAVLGCATLLRVGFPGSLFIAYAVAALGLGGMLALALGLSLHHVRRSRLPAYARRASAAVTEGPALLGGVVEADDDGSTGPVLSIDFPAPPVQGRRTRARPFALRLPSGASIRVEPAEGRWSLDSTFVPTERDGQTVYVALVEPGQFVYVAGTVGREIDPGVAGNGYRDVARTWVMRGDVDFSSAGVVARHAARARFHGQWAIGLAALQTALHACALEQVPAELWSRDRVAPPGTGAGLAVGVQVVVMVAVVGLAYWFRAEATTPWVRREVRV
jgi:hypothetical protein